jgi:integrase
MSFDRAQSVHLKHFSLSETALLAEGQGELVSTPLTSYRVSSAEATKASNVDNRGLTFPVVVAADGSPWPEACLFLISKFYDDQVHVRTCFTLARDLALYRRYLDEEGLSFQHFPHEKYQRVTYRYRAYLKLKIDCGEYSIKTAKRKISSVISFYKWMNLKKVLLPENSPWKERQILIKVDGDGRKPIYRQVETTDLAFKGITQADITLITDGGRLKPLIEDQQISLITKLSRLGNPEMYYAHLFALFSGARIQTVLTMRAEYIDACSKGPNNCAYIKVGPGTGVETKANKAFSLLVPWGLVEQLMVYIKSERYKRRALLSKGGRYKDKEYLFLTNRGDPYYHSGQDSILENKRYASEGAAIRQFINDRVIPGLRCEDECFRYSFHDLRASFAMNIYNSFSSLNGDQKVSVSYIREYLRFRLGHASQKALDDYMAYNGNNKVAAQAQHDWESRLDLFLERKFQ